MTGSMPAVGLTEAAGRSDTPGPPSDARIDDPGEIACHVATAPFDVAKLDELLADAGLELVLACSEHNVRYLAGSYSAFFQRFSAIGIDRYLPVVGYRRGRLDHAFLIVSELDRWQVEVAPPWMPTVMATCHTSVESAAAASDLVRKLDCAGLRIGVEPEFLPARAMEVLARELPHAEFVDASKLLAELRAVKTPGELELLRAASEGIVDSMIATVAATVDGATTADIARALQREQLDRGLEFDYCLTSTGASFNRAPSGRPWLPGMVLSLDSAGRNHGYMGDLCRMAVRGEPSPRLAEVLAEVRHVQDAARVPVRAGALGREIYEAATAALLETSVSREATFYAHGMGLTTHEAPWLTSTGPIRYPADHADRPLQSGMVLSIETDVRAPGLGFIKLEDTVAVTERGHCGFGDRGRDWVVGVS